MSTTLSLVNISKPELSLPDDLPFTDWEHVGEHLKSLAHNIQWQWGDWLNHGESRYGEKYKLAVERFGLNLNTAQQYARVARAFPSCNRLQLSWTHHHAAAGVDDDAERQQLLITAMGDGWSVSRLKQEIKSCDTPKIVPIKDRVLAIPDINEVLKHYPEFAGLHPVCEIMPLMTEREFWYLTRSVKEESFRRWEPLLRCSEGYLVDGKHRLMACYLTSTAIQIRDLEEYEDPIEICWSHNVLRKHLAGDELIQIEKTAFELESVKGVA